MVFKSRAEAEHGLILFVFIFEVGAKTVKAFLTDNVFKAAGIYCGLICTHANHKQPLRYCFVPCENSFRNFSAVFSLMNKTVTVGCDVSVFTQISHCNANAGF